MGVCLSTVSPSKPHKNSNNAPRNTHVSKSPPPSHPVPEEETVKEVLSETPSGRAQAERQPEGPFIKSAPLLLRDFSRKSSNPPKDPRNGVVLKKPSAADDASEDLVSEICSTLGESESASVSVSATDDRPRNRSPAKRKTAPFPGEARRDRTVGRSPGRRSGPEPSPSRDRPGNGNVRKRDGGESSGRRSRSPAMRADSGNVKPVSGRSASARRTAKSPGRVGSGLGERTRKACEERKSGGDNHWPPASDESLENPLASLECFIFL